MTHKPWQTAINLSSYNWKDDIKDFEIILLLGETLISLHVSLAFIAKQRDKIAEELGISS